MLRKSPELQLAVWQRCQITLAHKRASSAQLHCDGLHKACASTKHAALDCNTEIKPFIIVSFVNNALISCTASYASLERDS
jgi:hypothetical protein